MSDLASTSEKLLRAGVAYNEVHGDPADTLHYGRGMIEAMRAALASPAPAESGEPAWKVARMEALEKAKGIDGGDFAGCLEPPNDLATTLAIIAAGYEFTLDVDGRLAALVAGDMGYASTDILLEPLVMEAIGPSLRAGSPSTSGVGVRPLQWTKSADGDLSRAETIIDTYRVWTHFEADGRWFWSLSGVTDGHAKDEAEAKAAAQADYEARIRSALSAAPTQDGGK